MNTFAESPFQIISKSIASLREKKGKENEALSWIDEAINLGKGFIANLFFERILVYQHLVMEQDSKPDSLKDSSKRFEALAKMEEATLTAQKYAEENKLKEWQSRVYRFVVGCMTTKDNIKNHQRLTKKQFHWLNLTQNLLKKESPDIWR